MKIPEERSSAETILREIGGRTSLTIYLASAPGSGKTRRLIEELRLLQGIGKKVAIGWIETKERPDLEELSAGLEHIAPRAVTGPSGTFEEFDLTAAISAHPDVIVLDELAHTNLEGSPNAKRWQDALALRDAGISVLGAFNIQHLETVATTAEQIIGFPVREIIPLSFLKAADQVVALDVSPEILESRVRSGRIVRKEDAERALAGLFRPANLIMLRELMLRTVDELTTPVLIARKASTVLALVEPNAQAGQFIRRTAALAERLDLALDVAPIGKVDLEMIERNVRSFNAELVTLREFDPRNPQIADVHANIVAVMRGALAERLVTNALDRSIFVADPDAADIEGSLLQHHPYAQTTGDRLRIGYGKLIVFLGGAAGTGKTYAMLDRAHQLKESGVDVLAALVETHNRKDTIRQLEGLEVLPRKQFTSEGTMYGELDREGLIARRPAVALIDELAHTNPPGGEFQKRYEEVLSVLRAGISVITTLNVQHLEGLGEAVERLTGVHVRETLPDGILELADEVILVDVTPETLRERLRAGKIYPPNRIDSALTNFFKIENLAALRELAIREARRSRRAERPSPPFGSIVLGVAARERDVELIERCSRLAARLDIDLTVMHVAPAPPAAEDGLVAALQRATRAARAQWRFEMDRNAAQAIARFAVAESATIAVEGARGKKRLFSPAPFARRLLNAGAREMFVLAPIT